MQEFGGNQGVLWEMWKWRMPPGTKINTARWVSLGVRDRAHPVLLSAADQPK